MSGPQPEEARNVVGIAAAEAECILVNLHSLRDQIVVAWRERGIMLSAEERALLHSEIQETCKFLTDLTSNP